MLDVTTHLESIYSFGTVEDHRQCKNIWGYTVQSCVSQKIHYTQEWWRKWEMRSEMHPKQMNMMLWHALLWRFFLMALLKIKPLKPSRKKHETAKRNPGNVSVCLILPQYLMSNRHYRQCREDIRERFPVCQCKITTLMSVKALENPSYLRSRWKNIIITLQRWKTWEWQHETAFTNHFTSVCHICEWN